MTLIYDVFISYSHSDFEFAERLAKALGRYMPPIGSRLPRRRMRIYFDKAESAGTRLTRAITDALAQSRKLIVVCSPVARTRTIPRQPIGAKGIAEIGIGVGAPAIANAVFHATGKRVRELPITLEKLL